MLDYHRAAAPTQPAIDGSLHDLELETNHLDLVAYADYVIVHNEDARRLLIETGLIAPERVVMIHYGIPIDQFDPRDESKTPPELEAGRGPILLYVGGLDGAREIDTLMRMVARVRQEYADVRLVLIDSDRSTPSASSGGAIRKLAADLGVENSVIFAEPKDHADLARYYAACDVYVTVGGNEGFDATIAEAMASRKPVVAPNAGAPRAIVGDAGFLFEPDNLEEFAEQVLAVLDSKARAKGQVTPSSATPAVYGS
jgi:glycosyltransferase involved in cell wall biosynthesis